MKERVAAIVGNRAKVMWVMTFHSACVRILRENAKRLGFTTTFSIYDSADSHRLMTLVCRELDLDPKRYPPRAFNAQVSNLKNELIDPEDYERKASNSHEKTLAEAYTAYQRRLREANAFDFDDLIMVTVNLFQAFPDVAEHYRRRFRHVLVDEYQDTNHAQYTLVRELVGGAVSQQEKRTVDGDLVRSGSDVPPAELVVVGDADQSIYAFRGATIRNILEFERDYPNATVVLLEQNYRSTQTILSAANAVITAQRGPQGEEPVVRCGRRRADRWLCRRRRAGRSFLCRRGDRPVARSRSRGLQRCRDLLPYQRAVAGLRGNLHQGRAALQGRRRRAVLRTPRSPRPARLPTAAGEPRRHDLVAPDSERATPRHRRPR